MKRLITLTLIGVMAASAPVFAQSVNDEKMKSDVNAVDKDNAAIDKDRDALARNRAAKAEDKANGSYGKEAVDSMKIGGDKAAIGEKKTERYADKKVLQHHKNEATEDRGDADTSSAANHD